MADGRDDVRREVLFIHQGFVEPAEAGGTRHYELLSGLRAVGIDGHVLRGSRPYFGVDAGGDPASERLRITRVGAVPFRHGSYAYRMLSFVAFAVGAFWAGIRRGGAPSVVWVTSPPLPQTVPAILLAGLWRVPLVLEVRDLWPAFAVGMGVIPAGGVTARVLRLLERWAYRSADTIVVNSPGFVDHIRGIVGDGTPITLIPNGVDLEAFRSRGEPGVWRERLGIGAEETAVVYAGAHGAANALDDVLDAAGVLLRRGDSVRFVLVGEGKLKEHLRQRVHSEDLTNVILVDGQPKSEMPDLLADMDIGLATLQPIEEFSLTYPNKIFDYLAAGLPTVSNIQGVSAELIEEAGAGVVVEPGSGPALVGGIDTLRERPDAYDDMADAGRRLVADRFSRAAHVGQYAELFAALPSFGGRAKNGGGA